jgi:hypothetical protein
MTTPGPGSSPADTTEIGRWCTLELDEGVALLVDLSVHADDRSRAGSLFTPVSTRIPNQPDLDDAWLDALAGEVAGAEGLILDHSNGDLLVAITAGLRQRGFAGVVVSSPVRWVLGRTPRELNEGGCLTYPPSDPHNDEPYTGPEVIDWIVEVIRHGRRQP